MHLLDVDVVNELVRLLISAPFLALHVRLALSESRAKFCCGRAISSLDTSASPRRLVRKIVCNRDRLQQQRRASASPDVVRQNSATATERRIVFVSSRQVLCRRAELGRRQVEGERRVEAEKVFLAANLGSSEQTTKPHAVCVLCVRACVRAVFLSPVEWALSP